MSNLDNIEEFALIVEEIGFEAEPQNSPVKEKPQKALDYAPTGNLDAGEKGEDIEKAHENHDDVDVNVIDGIAPNNTEMADDNMDGEPDGVYSGDEREQREIRIDQGMYAECFENALHDPWKTLAVEDDGDFDEEIAPSGVTKSSKKGVAKKRNGYNGGRKNNRIGQKRDSVDMKKEVPAGPQERKTRKGDDHDRNSISGVQSKNY
jgi:hypothetical protein